MANHCLDVVCLNCGAFWCTLGCNTDSPPNKDTLEHFKKKFEERGWKMQCSNETCSHCKSREVYMT